MARLAEVMSAGVGAVSVRPPELCLWVDLSRWRLWDAGEAAQGVPEGAVRGLVEAGPPAPAR